MLMTFVFPLLLVFQTPTDAGVGDAGVATRARSLALSGSLIQKAEKYADAVEAFRKKPSDTGLCRLVVEADVLASAIQAPLLDRRTAL